MDGSGNIFLRGEGDIKFSFEENMNVEVSSEGKKLVIKFKVKKKRIPRVFKKRKMKKTTKSLIELEEFNLAFKKEKNRVKTLFSLFMFCLRLARGRLELPTFGL